jgi:cysteine-rich repeat protein
MKKQILAAFLGLAAALSAPIAARADVITVNTLDDDGDGFDNDCNFREALMAANGNIGLDACDAGLGADEIVFAPGLTGTISLASALPSVTDSLTITGPGADALTIDGGQHDSVFLLDSLTNDQTYSISGLTLTNGRGSDGGGGIYGLSGETVTVTRCVITKNFGDGKGHGGGIASESGFLTIEDSTVSDNESVAGGGGIQVYGIGTPKAVIRNSTVSGNKALNSEDGFGGGIDCSGCQLDIVNSTISGNEAGVSGGGLSNGGTVVLRNVTVTGNTADADGVPNPNDGNDDGGGLFNGGGANIFLKNSIIAGNEDAGGESPDCNGAVSSQDFNLFGATAGCTIAGTTTHNVTGQAALLGLLADNGGPTFTHALLSDSPALDAGDPTGCIDENDDPLTTDQRGFDRPVGSACDIGAFEAGGCGDGIADAARGEECDDGNSVDGDACHNDCTLPDAGGTTTGGGTSGGSDSGGCSLIR